MYREGKTDGFTTLKQILNTYKNTRKGKDTKQKNKKYSLFDRYPFNITGRALIVSLFNFRTNVLFFFITKNTFLGIFFILLIFRENNLISLIEVLSHRMFFYRERV